MQQNLGWIDVRYESANTIKCKNWVIAGFLFFPIGVRLFQEGAEQDGAEQGAVLDEAPCLARLRDSLDYPPIGATARACTLWKNIDTLWIL